MTDSLRAALWTALFTFLGTAGSALVGFLSAVDEWVNGGDASIADDWSVFAKLIVSAFIAGVSGIVNWAVRAAQAKGALPGSGPTY